MVEVECHPDTPIKVPGIAARPTLLPFSTPFSVEIINAPHYRKVKMPTIDLYDGTTDPEEHREFTKPRCMYKMWMTRPTTATSLPP